MNKIFKTFNDQIILLKNKGLTINDENELKWFLQAYNYQNIINGYNDFFMINNDRKQNKYKSQATSNGIIELFNFDREISKIILSSIQNIERMISTSIAYTIAEILNENNIYDGKIFSLDNNDLILKKYSLRKMVLIHTLKYMMNLKNHSKETMIKIKIYLKNIVILKIYQYDLLLLIQHLEILYTYYKI